jgi:hypothetical protein
MNPDKIRKLIEIIGNLTLAEAANWLEVKENAERLKAEIEADEKGENSESV